MKKREEKKQEMIWNFDNVVSEEEQIKRIDLFNEIIIDIAVTHYLNEKKDKKLQEKSNPEK